MRLLIALPDEETMRRLHYWLDESTDCHADFASNGIDAIRMIQTCCYDLVVLHACLAGVDGLTTGRLICSLKLLCPPKMLLLCPYEYRTDDLAWADCILSSGVSVRSLCRLIQILMQKPLPNTAAASQHILFRKVRRFLDELHLNPNLKGYEYAAWILMQMTPSFLNESKPIGEWYSACANAFQTSPSAVERCLRLAVESVFTMGSLKGIERFFGSSVDPEKGKLTNRAFLRQAAQDLRLNITL